MVAGPGIAPGLGDYEPPVQLYTTPRHESYKIIITGYPEAGKAGYMVGGEEGLRNALISLGAIYMIRPVTIWIKKCDGKIGGDIKMEHSY